MSYDTDESEARELVLFADNTQPIYQTYLAIQKTLAKHVARGDYTVGSSRPAWKSFVEYAAKEYDREFGNSRKPSMTVFTKAARDLATTEFAERFAAEVEGGEHDALILSVMSQKRKAELAAFKARMTASPARSNPAGAGYKLVLKAATNRYTGARGMTRTVKVYSSAEATAATDAFVRDNDVYSSNYDGGTVYDSRGRAIARTSYNGRVWPPGPYDPDASNVTF